jgi:hypothetical protein
MYYHLLDLGELDYTLTVSLLTINIHLCIHIYIIVDTYFGPN